MSRVLGIAVAEIVLNETQIISTVGERESAGVTKHVRMDFRQPSPLGRCGDDVVDGLAGEWLSALGDEEPRQMIVARGKPALDGAQLIAGDRLLDG